MVAAQLGHLRAVTTLIAERASLDLDAGNAVSAHLLYPFPVLPRSLSFPFACSQLTGDTALICAAKHARLLYQVMRPKDISVLKTRICWHCPQAACARLLLAAKAHPDAKNKVRAILRKCLRLCLSACSNLLCVCGFEARLIFVRMHPARRLRRRD